MSQPGGGRSFRLISKPGHCWCMPGAPGRYQHGNTAQPDTGLFRGCTRCNFVHPGTAPEIFSCVVTVLRCPLMWSSDFFCKTVGGNVVLVSCWSCSGVAITVSTMIVLEN